MMNNNSHMSQIIEDLSVQVKAIANQKRELRFAFDSPSFRRTTMALLSKEADAIALLDKLAERAGMSPLSFAQFGKRCYVTFQEVADYYGMSPGSMKTYMTRDKDELQQIDGAEILEGAPLKEFRKQTKKIDPSLTVSRYGIWTPQATLRLGTLIAKPSLIMSVRVKLGIIRHLNLHQYCKKEWAEEWRAIHPELQAKMVEAQVVEPLAQGTIDDIPQVTSLPSETPTQDIRALTRSLIQQGEGLAVAKLRGASIDLSKLPSGPVVLCPIDGYVTDQLLRDAYLEYHNYIQDGSMPLVIVTNGEVDKAAEILARGFGNSVQIIRLGS